MNIINTNKKHFRAIGHTLKPVVTVSGKGLTESVMAEINRAFDDHELIKIKLALSERDHRKRLTQVIVENCKAELIQEIGKIVLLFRKSEKPKLQQSNLQRVSTPKPRAPVQREKAPGQPENKRRRRRPQSR